MIIYLRVWLIKNVINECDYYILIIGGRYGSTNKEGKSYTQLEYEYAKEIGKPLAAFIFDKPEILPDEKKEKEEKGKQALEVFKSNVKNYMVNFWNDKNELALKVLLGLRNLVDRFPAEGWVKTGAIVDTESIKEVNRLQSENRQLREQLNEANTKPPKGAENLAQGNDLVEIQYYLKIIGEDKLEKVSVTWNQLFVNIFLSLRNGTSTNEIRRDIEKMILANTVKNADNNEPLLNIELTSESLQAVIIQLLALGLIKQDPTFTGHWIMTMYGETTLAQLLAKHR